ncbi:uncharacterized protein TNCV_253031 [Trichonephila clavipes]|nr:uncharacterized protein TNCV_253031 [Trichonephila clavipes]
MVQVYCYIHWCAKIKDEVEKLAYQLNEEAERKERPIRRLSKVMYGSTCADMQIDVMGECLSSIKHVVSVRSVFCQSPCYQRLKLKGRIATEKMLLKTFHDLKSTFHTSNPSLMETTNAAATEHQMKLDALVSERDSLPECLTFNCQYCNKSNPTTPVVVNAPIKNKNSHTNKKAKTAKNENKTPDNVNNKTSNNDNSKSKKKFKKRKLKKDSVEDFVFPSKTARPASPSNSEPVATANSFTDLVEDQKQVLEDKEAKLAEVPNPRPLQPIHLKITKKFRNQIKSIYQKFPETINKSSGNFIKLYSKDVDEKHKLTQFLESNKDFEYFCIKPKLDKPIKVVIKGLPIFSKTQDIHSDLEEEGFSIEKVSQLTLKNIKAPSHFF